jgi:palmitoyl-protein thioesterase
MHERDIYQEDLIGLRTLDEQKKLEVVTVPHIIHVAWHLNITLIDQVIVPHLD